MQFFISHLASWLRTRRFSEPTFRPSGATNHWKNTVFCDFPTFSRAWIFFLLRLSLFWSSFFSLLFSDSSRLCFSSVHIVGSLTSKLPSTTTTTNYTKPHHTTLHSAVVGEVTTAIKHNSNHLSVHQWIRSAIHASQQLTSPIVVYLWNFRHRLVWYYWYTLSLYIHNTRTCICYLRSECFKARVILGARCTKCWRGFPQAMDQVCSLLRTTFAMLCRTCSPLLHSVTWFCDFKTGFSLARKCNWGTAFRFECLRKDRPTFG